MLKADSCIHLSARRGAAVATVRKKFFQFAEIHIGRLNTPKTPFLDHQNGLAWCESA